MIRVGAANEDTPTGTVDVVVVVVVVTYEKPEASSPYWESVFVTLTATPVTAECADVLHVILVALTTVTPVHAAVPMSTVAPARNPVPVMVTEVSPASSPELGETDDTVGAGTYVYAFAPVPDRESLFVTTTSTCPPARAPVVHVIEVGPTTVTEAQATPPTLTVAPALKPVPETVTAVAPTAGPDEGTTCDTVGAGYTTVTTPAT